MFRSAGYLFIALRQYLVLLTEAHVEFFEVGSSKTVIFFGIFDIKKNKVGVETPAQPVTQISKYLSAIMQFQAMYEGNQYEVREDNYCRKNTA